MVVLSGRRVGRCFFSADLICVAAHLFFLFQAEDGIRGAQESRGLGDVYKRQVLMDAKIQAFIQAKRLAVVGVSRSAQKFGTAIYTCLLYTSDAADDLLCVDLGGRRIIKKKKRYTPLQRPLTHSDP